MYKRQLLILFLSQATSITVLECSEVSESRLELAIHVARSGRCIIRSRLLGEIKEAYDKNPKLTNLLVDNFFAGVLNNH